MLQYLLERVERSSELDAVVVATSVEASDDPIEHFCRSNGFACCRGPLENVAERFLLAAGMFSFDAFARICGDSPLLDPALIDEAVAAFRRLHPDMATNCMTRTYPPGQSVEVLDAGVFARAVPLMASPGEREHVTTFFKSRPESFRIHQLLAKTKYEGISLSVDQREDMDLFGRVVARMDAPHYVYGLDDVMKIYRDVLAR